MLCSADFSPCRTWRYALWRRWDEDYADYAMVVGLNPSTADETHDDPTVRRCIRYAREWGYGGLCMTNIFGYRSTDPRRLWEVDDPVGPDNDRWLQDCAGHAGIVVAAWGVHGAYRDRGTAVHTLLPELHVLKLTKVGHPSHPLYLPASLQPMRWESLS